MMRFLLILAVLYLIACVLGWLVKLWVTRKLHRLFQTPASRDTPQAAASTMVQCATCGTYVSKDRASTKGGAYYCCPEHRDASE